MSRKSKKGFTLIELMVVVAIFGVLVLLSLRTYAPQKERAANSIVKANAGTVQTMLVGYMGDQDILLSTNIPDCLGPEAQMMLENMVNPYDGGMQVYRIDGNTSGTSVFEDLASDGTYKGMVDVLWVDANVLYVNGRGKFSEIIMQPNSLPANKY